MGIEAVSDEQLSAYNKKTDLEINTKCVEIINATSAECVALMITPIDATKEYFKQLCDWVIKVDLKLVTVSIFTPIPGTPTYEEYKGQYTTDRIDHWDFLHLVLKPTNLSKKEFYLEYYKMLIKLYRRSKKSQSYDFDRLDYYKGVLVSFLRRQIRGD